MPAWTPETHVRKTGFILLGFAAGILAEIGSLIASFFGTNLFHGGQPHAIVNALLPCIGILDHLSTAVPRAIPVLLLAGSLIQFPLYGILAGRDLANKALSRISIGFMALHVLASAVAFYGMALDMRWRDDMTKYGKCIMASPSAVRLAANSEQIVRLVKSIGQEENELKRLQAEKQNGATFTPDPEPGLVKNIEFGRHFLRQLFDGYKQVGGPAKTPEEVQPIPSPCGNPPARPTFF